ncbi:MAG: hypothetical protein K2N18_06315, partial [Clostridia bacterium]|nr:hypothetical protein [Clostridia bacterium]
NKEADLNRRGLQMTVQLEERIKSDTYSKYCGGDFHESERRAFFANDYDTPTRVYQITVPDAQTILSKMSDYDENEWNELPNSIKEQLLNKVSIQTIVNQINFQNGSDMLWVTSVYIATKQFNNYSLKNDVTYLYVFETGKPIIVTFAPYNGGIKATAQFLVTEKVNSLSSLREVFEPFDCTVTALN